MSTEPLTLLCFSYAGGSAGFYARWRRVLPNIRVIPVEIPLRGGLKHAPALLTRDGLIDYLMAEYARWCVHPFALFGHSLGGRVAFEFQCVLEQTRGLKAVRLFISGCLAPERFSEAMRTRERDLSDSALLRMLADLGGTPPELMANPALMNTALPMIRADFQLAIDLSKRTVTPVSVPIDLLLGNRDKVTSLFDDYPAWAFHTSNGCQVSVIDGDHFFIRSQAILVARLVGKRLQEFVLNED
ncbi:thioesterase [Pseudomonas kairouanensis]|uniref:Thioesterase n=1 Tax=Pseudomonas kairouanensis TaxID=2293832 RepID=A0A4Z0B082_9PSED|nr:alpha/beta fold hydrolase [Pseudomonas kairouanensis]TFY92446.1 thioesterase [Pseudomonas kairouanensis]